MAENNLKPSLRFRGFTDNWEQCEFRSIFNYERPDEYIVSSEEYSDIYSTPVLTANKGFILGYTNEIRIYERPCVIFDDFTLDSKYVDFPFMVKSTAMKILTTKDGFDLRFAYELFNSTKIENLGHARHYISVVQPTQVKAPKFPEQTKISELFKKIDILITLHQRKYDKFVKTKKALLDKMFPKNGEVVPQIRFKGFTEAWEQCELQSIIEKFSTGLNPRDNFTLNSGGINYYVTIKNFTHGNLILDNQCDKIDDEAMKLIQNRSNLERGDILFSSIGRVGDCVLLDDKPKNWNINESVFALKPTKNKVDPLYLMHTIHSDIVLSDILNKVTGSTFSSIKMAQLRKTVIPFSSKDEQAKIGKFIQLIDNLITLHQRKIDKLKDIKKSLLKKMFI